TVHNREAAVDRNTLQLQAKSLTITKKQPLTKSSAASSKKLAPVLAAVAAGAERDQIIKRVATQFAAELQVMNLQFLIKAANFATPTIALQHATFQQVVGLSLQLQSRLLFVQSAGSSFSRFEAKSSGSDSFRQRLAPARKSAHIISRQ